MPLPTGSNAQETKELVQLYDEYCKIAFKEILRGYYSDPNANITDLDKFVAEVSHSLAQAMLEFRGK